MITRVAVAVLVIAVGLGGLWALGAANPPKRPAVTTDRLGVSGDESVEQYLSAASDGLARARGTRWALISLRSPLDDDAALPLTADTAPSQVALHVTVAGVATPTAVVPLTHDRGSLRTARDLAATAAADAATGGPTDRDTRIAALVGSRLGSGCACVVALVVRAPVDRLRTVAADVAVRGVEVLPRDAAGGRFTVTPLLPEQTGTVGPLPDTAPVPDR